MEALLGWVKGLPWRTNAAASFTGVVLASMFRAAWTMTPIETATHRTSTVMTLTLPYTPAPPRSISTAWFRTAVGWMGTGSSARGWTQRDRLRRRHLPRHRGRPARGVDTHCAGADDFDADIVRFVRREPPQRTACISRAGSAGPRPPWVLPSHLGQARASLSKSRQSRCNPAPRKGTAHRSRVSGRWLFCDRSAVSGEGHRA